MVSAVMAHDPQIAAGGITTSYDCVCVGVSIKHPERREIFRPMIDAVREASTKGMLRADHIVHLRCEVTDEEVVELFDAVADHAAVGMMSLMDHAPGHRQYPDVKRFRERRSEEHTSELQSLMRISYAVFCLKKNKI